ncbi:uncharacterized protein LOC123550672 [Mercenaria mercenaria]|uniref:uncharacterized protein LOC123550672 n=1 Tax=Mercenaria mercenaria TaxID=6596 RepID=UPI00234E44EF|nr:uncharacterized protein LOC123550672 [Mercenaria mercenaria]
MASASEPFDVVISFDTTGSMYNCLDQVKRRMRVMMKNLKSSIPDIHLGVIAHGDYDTHHVYVIKYEKLTDNVESLCRFVNDAKNTGGGKPHRNNDEAYELALHYANTKVNWRPNSSRTLILIGDHRPHERNYILNKQHIDWREEILDLRDMCETNVRADSFYQNIASATFGHHVALTDFNKVEEVLMSICYREAGLGLECSKEEPVLKRSNGSAVPDFPIVLSSELSDPDSKESDEEEDEGIPVLLILNEVGLGRKFIYFAADKKY